LRKGGSKLPVLADPQANLSFNATIAINSAPRQKRVYNLLSGHGIFLTDGLLCTLRPLSKENNLMLLIILVVLLLLFGFGGYRMGPGIGYYGGGGISLILLIVIILILVKVI
jgi:hypothetical protein